MFSGLLIQAIVKGKSDMGVVLKAEADKAFMEKKNQATEQNAHSFICEKVEDLRIYFNLHDDMEKNTLFATLGNKESRLNTEMTFKFGIVNAGKLSPDRQLILDLEHLNLFNAIQANEIKIFLPEKYNMLVSKVKVLGKNDTYFNMNIYNALLKN